MLAARAVRSLGFHPLPHGSRSPDNPNSILGPDHSGLARTHMRRTNEEPPTKARTCVGGWLPTAASSGRILADVPVAARRPTSPSGKLKEPPIVRQLALAEEFRSLLVSGAVRNQAGLAHLTGLTRARVTQIMNLLKLAPEIRAYLRGLSGQPPKEWATERKLRGLTALSPTAQMDAARCRLPGFGGVGPHQPGRP